jgi:hypothetical protein
MCSQTLDAGYALRTAHRPEGETKGQKTMATTGSFYDLSEVDIDVSVMAVREVCHAGTLRAMCLPLLSHL